MKLLKRVGQGALILALLVIAGCNRHPAASSLLLGGDVMLYRAGEPIFPVGYSSFSPWGDLLTVKRILPVDLFAVNLESPFGLVDVTEATNKAEMNLCAADDAVALLQQAGVTLATNSNNHAYDCGREDPGHTGAILQQAGIQAPGEHSETLYVSAGDQTVAVISLNDYEGDYDPETISGELETARRKSDLVLVSIHWGSEYKAGPTQHQQELAQILIDSGADIVWGHHPHVLQRMEWLRSSVDGHEGLVMYSLGNLLSDQWMLPDALRTAPVRIEFSEHRINEIIVIPMEMEMNKKQLILVENKVGLEWFAERFDLDRLTMNDLKVKFYKQDEYD